MPAVMGPVTANVAAVGVTNVTRTGVPWGRVEGSTTSADRAGSGAEMPRSMRWISALVARITSPTSGCPPTPMRTAPSIAYRP